MWQPTKWPPRVEAPWTNDLTEESDNSSAASARLLDKFDGLIGRTPVIGFCLLFAFGGLVISTVTRESQEMDMNASIMPPVALAEASFPSLSPDSPLPEIPEYSPPPMFAAGVSESLPGPDRYIPEPDASRPETIDITAVAETPAPAVASDIKLKAQSLARVAMAEKAVKAPLPEHKPQAPARMALLTGEKDAPSAPSQKQPRYQPRPPIVANALKEGHRMPAVPPPVVVAEVLESPENKAKADMQAATAALLDVDEPSPAKPRQKPRLASDKSRNADKKDIRIAGNADAPADNGSIRLPLPAYNQAAARLHTTDEGIQAASADQLARIEPAVGQSWTPHHLTTVSVAFNAGDNVLRNTHTQMLSRKVISALKKNQSLKLEIQSYATAADKGASSARRISLSRALAVRTYLVEQGIDPDRLELRALGDDVDDDKAGDRIDVVFIDPARSL